MTSAVPAPRKAGADRKARPPVPLIACSHDGRGQQRTGERRQTDKHTYTYALLPLSLCRRRAWRDDDSLHRWCAFAVSLHRRGLMPEPARLRSDTFDATQSLHRSGTNGLKVNTSRKKLLDRGLRPPPPHQSACARRHSLLHQPNCVVRRRSQAHNAPGPWLPAWTGTWSARDPLTATPIRNQEDCIAWVSGLKLAKHAARGISDHSMMRASAAEPRTGLA
ncbi:hypothetical protein CC78DRAFT_614632 [Lojkania enalia]|uniref:Uncharacterized protein n=1 Tax=Lojkania enalia TaxID=147567 RepID=A0A9P4KHX6_9PLEO|nr:hypothetical protein CC78DRAFT_614632 [Didymosphaeria enalia]